MASSCSGTHKTVRKPDAGEECAKVSKIFASISRLDEQRVNKFSVDWLLIDLQLRVVFSKLEVHNC
jgi:hypothetical protein